MFRGTLTLLVRSLRDDARLRRAHAFRIASIVVACGLLIEAHVMRGSIGAPGLRFFHSLCLLNFGLITLAGFSYFASVITEEKEEGTLGLLKLADLSTLSILLGKSTSRLLAALLVFTGQLPFALLAITLGGVTVHQIVAAYLALAAYMVLVANVALLCSVLCRRSGSAAVWMMLVSLLFLALVPLLYHARADLKKSGLMTDGAPLVDLVWWLVDRLYEASILTRIDAILATGFDGAVVSPQVVLSLAGALACFAASWIVFDRFTEYVDRSQPARGLVPRVRSRRLLRVARPWRWALVWKDFHFVAGGPIVVALKLALYPLIIVALFWQAEWVRVVFGLSLREAVWTAGLVMAAAELLLYATRIFQHEKKWGTLPCLALLPRTSISLGYAKLAGCLLGSVPTLLLLVGLDLVLPAGGRTIPEWCLEEAFVAGLVLFALVLQLTVLYSLIVRWGALPLALATLLVGGTCLAPFISAAVGAITTAGHSDLAEVAPILYTGGVLSALLQFLIALRFRAAAAQ